MSPSKDDCRLPAYPQAASENDTTGYGRSGGPNWPGASNLPQTWPTLTYARRQAASRQICTASLEFANLLVKDYLIKRLTAARTPSGAAARASAVDLNLLARPRGLNTIWPGPGCPQVERWLLEVLAGIGAVPPTFDRDFVSHQLVLTGYSPCRRGYRTAVDRPAAVHALRRSGGKTAI